MIYKKSIIVAIVLIALALFMALYQAYVGAMITIGIGFRFLDSKEPYPADVQSLMEQATNQFVFSAVVSILILIALISLIFFLRKNGYNKVPQSTQRPRG